MHAFLLAATDPSSVNVGDILKFGITPVLIIVLLLTGILRIGTFEDRKAEALRSAAEDRLGAEKDRAEKAERRAEQAEDRERRLREAASDIGPAFKQTSVTMERVLDFLLRGAPPPPPPVTAFQPPEPREPV